MNKIIERIAKLRDERKWTNYRLSVEAGIGSATVINWYKRNATPKIEAIQALCVAFGISLCEFFNYENEQVSLSDNQKEFLSEYDQLNKNEKNALLNFVKTMNETKKQFISKR